MDDIDPPIFLKFKILNVETPPTKALDYPYYHSKVKVNVDSEDAHVYPKNYRPLTNSAEGPTVTQTHSHEWTGGGSVSIGTKTGISGTANVNRRVNETDERVRNIWSTTAYAQETEVTWEYDVRDPKQQQRGLQVEIERLPFVEFWPERHAQVQKPFRVELSSYWSTRTPKKGTKFLPFPAFWKRQPMPLLRNFCHVTCIMLPSNLSKIARLKLQLEAHMLPSIVKENSAIFASHNKPSSDLEGVTVDGDVELLDPSGNRLKKQKDTSAGTIRGDGDPKPLNPSGNRLGKQKDTSAGMVREDGNVELLGLSGSQLGRQKDTSAGTVRLDETRREGEQ